MPCLYVAHLLSKNTTLIILGLLQRFIMSMLRARSSMLAHPANSWGRWASLCGSRGVPVEDLVNGPAPGPDHAALTPPDTVGNLPSDLAQWHLSEVRK